MLLKRNKEMIHFSGRRHTKLGIASAITGAIVLLGFLIISMISGLAGGKGGYILGIIGVVFFLMAVAGFIMAYQAFRKKDIFYRFPIIGIVLNGIMVILLLIIYMLGI